MTLQYVPLEGRAPQMMSVRGVQIVRRRVHNQQLMAKRALPRHSAKMSEKCVVIVSHVASIEHTLRVRNLL